MDLGGIAAIITSITGLGSLLISVYLIYRVMQVKEATKHIEHLTNSNFSKMQTLLEQAVKVADAGAKRERRRMAAQDTSPEKDT